MKRCAAANSRCSPPGTGAPHARDAQGAGRLLQFLHLLHHSLRARAGAFALPLEQAVAQTRRLREEGYREIVFTGIEISSWGHDFKDGSSLIDLLEAVSAAAGDMRLRLGSLEPRTITEDFCRRAARLPNLCEQFHLSLQSGCDETLRRMNRRYDTARFAASVHLLRAYFDRPAITTDLITGFPGETEEEFAQTLDFIRACDFARMHIFPYSIRPGTKAAAMEQLPRAVKEERAARAAAVAEQMRQSYLAGCVGCTYPSSSSSRRTAATPVTRRTTPTSRSTERTCTTRCAPSRSPASRGIF